MIMGFKLQLMTVSSPKELLGSSRKEDGTERLKGTPVTSIERTLPGFLTGCCRGLRVADHLHGVVNCTISLSEGLDIPFRNRSYFLDYTVSQTLCPSIGLIFPLSSSSRRGSSGRNRSSRHHRRRHHHHN